MGVPVRQPGNGSGSFLVRTRGGYPGFVPKRTTSAQLWKRLGTILEAARSVLKIKLNLWNIQNLYVEVCRQRASFLQAHKEVVTSFASRIQLNPGVLSLGPVPAGAPEPD